MKSSSHREKVTKMQMKWGFFYVTQTETKRRGIPLLCRCLALAGSLIQANVNYCFFALAQSRLTQAPPPR